MSNDHHENNSDPLEHVLSTHDPQISTSSMMSNLTGGEVPHLHKGEHLRKQLEQEIMLLNQPVLFEAPLPKI